MAGSSGNISVTYTGLDIPGGASVQPSFSDTMNNPILETLNPVLASGFNQFTIPNGATRIWIFFPSPNAYSKTLKGATGDTGLPLDPTGLNGPLKIPTGNGSGTFGITSGGNDTLNTQIWFR